MQGIGGKIGSAIARVIDAAIRRNEAGVQKALAAVTKLAEDDAAGMLDSVEELSDQANGLLSRWRRLLRIDIGFRWRNLFLPGKPVISFVPVFDSQVWKVQGHIGAGGTELTATELESIDRQLKTPEEPKP